MSEELKACFICLQIKREGINLLNSFICQDCEFKIVNTNVEGEQYLEFIRKLKKIWEPVFLHK